MTTSLPQAPIAAVVLSLTDVTISESTAKIYLWPADQRSGPISAYQVIVMKVVDRAEDLPNDYDSKLKDNANKDNLNFYIAAEIGNNPVREEPWGFTVGDDKMYGAYKNKRLEKEENYIVYQRAVTFDKNVSLVGVSTKVAKISIAPGDKPAIKGLKDINGVFRAAVIALSCIVFVLLVIIGVLIWRLRRAVPTNRATTADGAIKAGGGEPDLPRDQDVSEPGFYMELSPRPSEGQSRAPPEYTSLQGANKNPEHYNVGFSGNGLPFPRDQQMSEPGSYMALRTRPSEGQSRAPPAKKTSPQGANSDPEYYNVGFNGNKLPIPRDQQMSEPGLYTELQPRPSGGKSRASSDYKSRQGTKKGTGYYNVGFNKGKSGNKDEEVYDEIGNAQR